MTAELQLNRTLPQRHSQSFVACTATYGARDGEACRGLSNTAHFLLRREEEMKTPNSKLQHPEKLQAPSCELQTPEAVARRADDSPNGSIFRGPATQVCSAVFQGLPSLAISPVSKLGAQRRTPSRFGNRRYGRLGKLLEICATVRAAIPAALSTDFGVWSLEFGVFLDVGVWSLEFSSPQFHSASSENLHQFVRFAIVGHDGVGARLQ